MDFDFGKNLKRICNAQGLSPTKVVVELGFSNSKVANWNKGSLPKAEMLVMLAERLNCSVMDFFKTEEEWNETPKDELNDDEKDIIRVFRSLSRRSKHEFMSTLYEYEKREILTGDNTDHQSSIG